MSALSGGSLKKLPGKNPHDLKVLYVPRSMSKQKTKKKHDYI